VVKHVDVRATRGTQRPYGEAKGRTASVGLDVDTLCGQLLHRLPQKHSAWRSSPVSYGYSGCGCCASATPHSRLRTAASEFSGGSVCGRRCQRAVGGEWRPCVDAGEKLVEEDSGAQFPATVGASFLEDRLEVILDGPG